MTLPRVGARPSPGPDADVYDAKVHPVGGRGSGGGKGFQQAKAGGEGGERGGVNSSKAWVERYRCLQSLLPNTCRFGESAAGCMGRAGTNGSHNINYRCVVAKSMCTFGYCTD